MLVGKPTHRITSAHGNPHMNINHLLILHIEMPLFDSSNQNMHYRGLVLPFQFADGSEVAIKWQ